MERKSNIILLLLFIVFALVGCRSAKNIKSVTVNDSSLVEQVQQMQALRPIERDITAKVRIQMGVDGKSLSSGGSFSVEQDKGMRIGITAMGLFEVARLDISPSEAIFVNKIGKEYARLSYADTGFLGRIGLDYNILESVLLNKPFSPDGKDFALSLPRMAVFSDSTRIIVNTEKKNNMRYTFCFNPSTGELVRSEGVYNDEVRVICSYGNFVQLTDRTFPRDINLVVEGIGRTIALDLKLSNIKEDIYTFNMSNVGSYKVIDIARIFEILQ